MKLVKGSLKKIIVWLLIVIMVVGCLSTTVSASTSADRISTYISLGAGKQISDVDLNKVKLSQKDLQFLGVYISNFFVPFGTELGSSRSDVTTTNKEDIKTALQTSLKFSDAMADSLTETLLGLSRSSVKQLVLCVSKNYQTDLKSVSGSVEEGKGNNKKTYTTDIPLNYYTVLSCMLGGLPTIASSYKHPNSVIQGISDGTYKYGYFAYQTSTGLVPVFDFRIDMSEITPSHAAFIKCLESVNMLNGYGFNFFDFTSSELKDSESNYKKLNESFTDEEIYKMSAYGSYMAVDCFGNIIIMGGNHQYIAVPGCMNPYAWVSVDENGNTIGKGLGGTAYNMVNIPSMSLGVDDGSGNNSLILNVEDRQTVTEQLTLKFDEQPSTTPTFKHSDLITAMTYVIDYCGGSDVEKEDFKILYSSSEGLRITAKAEKLALLNPEKATRDWVKNKSKNASKAEKMLSWLDFLSNNMNEDKLVQSIKNIQKTGSNSIKNTPDVSLLRGGVLDTRTFVSKLQEMDWEDNGYQFELRKVRGASDTSFSDSIFGIEIGTNSYRELAKKAENGYLSSYKSGSVYNYYNSTKDGINMSWDFKLGTTQTIDIYGSKTYNVKNVTELQGFKFIYVMDSYIYIDDLGSAHFDNSDASIKFETFNPDHYLNASSFTKAKESIASWSTSANNGFTNMYNDVTSGKMIIPEVSDEVLLGIYFTYAWASLYDSSTEGKKSTIGDLGYKLNSGALPEIPDKALIIPSEAQSDMMEKSIKEWVYYLLHPTDGLDYFKIWIGNKLNSFLLGWHDDMVGTNGTGSINGTTKYRGFSGYVTTPELTDIPWTNSLLNMYNNAIPFLIVIMILIMLGSYVVGMLSFQKAVIGLVIFAICIALPAPLINGCVGVSNRFSSSLYGEKFTYWALIQHQSYSSAIDSAASSGSYSNYLHTLFEENAAKTGNQGSESIMLKWQAPKKMASLMLTENDRSVFDSLSSSSLISGLINSTYSGESYVDSENSYLYRSYIDIANFSRYIHRGLIGANHIKPIDTSLTNSKMSSWDESLKESILSLNSNYTADRNHGYTNVNKDGSTNSTGLGNSVLRVKLPLSSQIVSDALKARGTVSDLSLGEYVGIDQRAFNFAIPMFNVNSVSYKSVLEQDGYVCKYPDSDYSGLAAYGLMSESVFYYFSWYLYETGLDEEASRSSGYRNLLLGQDNGGFFYNTKGNGELKDFMDMKSLFTYVIPYLRQGNDLVKEWDETYGIFIYEDVPYEEGHERDSEILNNPELRQKYWHNVNVMRLYNIYTPWVDVMYDCSYADEEKISYLGEDYVVADPLNPSSYPDERPMIFSRSEMEDYGLDEYNLTKVEKLILKCEEGMQERMFKLLNYHTFNDVVLNTAAAMNCAFEFNETFSENSIIGANNNIYPQSYELADFSYDAFLRFILSNSTGDSMVVGEGESFYENVVNNSSMTTIIVMLVLDILAMYVIPGFKMFFLIGVFLLSILIILATAFRVDQQQKFITKLIKSFILPVVQFTLVTCGMALIVSWFMGEGNTSITGQMGTSIQVGDPVMVMLLMIVLNCFVIFAYYKILAKVIKDIKSNGKMVGAFIGGVVGGVANTISSVFKKSTKVSSESSSSSSSASSGGSSGSSSASPRAKQRGAIRRGVEETSNKGKDSGVRTEEYRGYNTSSKKKDSKKSAVDIDGKTEKGLNKLLNQGKKEE